MKKVLFDRRFLAALGVCIGISAGFVAQAMAASGTWTNIFPAGGHHGAVSASGDESEVEPEAPISLAPEEM